MKTKWGCWRVALVGIRYPIIKKRNIISVERRHHKKRNKIVKFKSLDDSLSIGFIKSLPVLAHLELTSNQIKLIELVLSFTKRGLPFYMNYDDIADYLVLKRTKNKAKVVGTIVNDVKKLGYITTETTSNFKGQVGGSSTQIWINEPFLEERLHRVFNPDMFLEEQQVEEIAKSVGTLKKGKGVEELASLIKLSVSADAEAPEDKQEDWYSQELDKEEELEKTLKYQNGYTIGAEKSDRTEFSKYLNISSIGDFKNMLIKASLKNEMQNKQTAFKHLLTLTETRDLEYLKGAFEALILS